MKDRIKKIIESQHMTQQEFAETIKVAPATLSSIFTGRTAPSLKIVEAIKSRFPDISTDWLMFGRGAMTDYKDAESGSQLAAHPSPTGQETVDFAVGNAASLSQDVATDSIPASVASSVADGQSAGGRQASGISAGRRNADNRPAINGFHMVNNCDTKERKIVEIRIFYDDQTWETFVPKK